MSVRGLSVAAAALIASGCATPESPFSGHLDSPAPQVRECAEWFRMLDARVEEAGVRDAQDARVPGFPYLRANRLLAALRPEAEASGAALQALAEQMQALDLAARRYEIMNLPARRVAEMAGATDHNPLRRVLDRTQRCGRLLRLCGKAAGWPARANGLARPAS